MRYMHERINKFPFLALLLAIPLILIPIKSAGNIKTLTLPEKEKHYLDLFHAGENEKAIQSIRNFITKETGFFEIELFALNLFEASEIPEQMKQSLSVYSEITSLPSIQTNPALRQKILLLSSVLYKHLGEIEKSRHRSDKAGAIPLMNIFGPFPCNTIKQFGLRDHLDPAGKPLPSSFVYSSIHRFTVRSDPAGVIDISSLNTGDSGSCYYLTTYLIVPEKGTYRISIGKSCPMKIFLNGTEIFRNTDSHFFFHDQYESRVKMGKGIYLLTVKVGTPFTDPPDEVKTSICVTSAHSGIPVPCRREWEGINGGFRFMESSHSSLIKNARSITGESFMEGYIQYMHGLSDSLGKQAWKNMSAGTRDKSFRSFALYYLSRIEKEIHIRHRYLLRALMADGSGRRILSDIVDLSLRRHMIPDALKYLEKIKRNSLIYWAAKCRVLMELNWYPESILQASSDVGQARDSLRRIFTAQILEKNGRYLSAQEHYETLINDCGDFTMPVISGLLRCYEKTGSYNKSIVLLHRAIECFPQNISLRLQLCSMIERTEGSAATLPYMSSALNISPSNPDILKAAGDLYVRLNRKNIALRYYQKSLENRTDDLSLRNYLDSPEIKLKRTYSDRSLSAEYPTSRHYAESSNNPVLILENEVHFTLHASGFYSKKGRILLMANTRSPGLTTNFLDIPSGIYNERLLYAKYRQLDKNRLPQYRKCPVTGSSSRKVGISIKKNGMYEILYVTVSRKVNTFLGESINLYTPNLIGGYILTAEFPFSRQLNVFHNPKLNITISNSKKQHVSLFRVRCRVSDHQHARDLHTMVISPFKNWADLHDYLWESYSPRMRIDDQMDKLTAVSNKENRDAPISKIQDVLSSIPIDSHFPEYFPGRTDLTYHNRRGHSLDISLLGMTLGRRYGMASGILFIRKKSSSSALPYFHDFSGIHSFFDIQGGLIWDGHSFITIRTFLDTNRDSTVFLLNETEFKQIR